MNNSPTDVARALADAARLIHSRRTLNDTLNAIVEAALASVPGFDQVGVSVVQYDGRIETLAGTNPLVRTLDELQYGLGEGPLVDALQGGLPAICAVERLRHVQDWPRYAPRAVEAGLRAQLSLRLDSEHARIGFLNLYSTSSETVDPEAVHIAELFATHAATALGHARREESLNDALSTRKVIGQAIGLTMARYEIDEDRAFHFLVRASTTSNVKLRDIAKEVVDLTNEQYTPAGSGGE